LHKIPKSRLALVNELNRSNPDGQERILREIGSTSDTRLIPDIFPHLFSSKQVVAMAAADSTAKLVRTLRCDDYPLLDYQFRQVTEGWRGYESGGLNIEPSQVSRLSKFGAWSVGLLGIASFHPNGFVRQAAVEHLDLHRSGEELPFILLRLNDWVVQVRDKAVEAIEARLAAEYAVHFSRYLPLVLRLERCGRASHSVVVEKIRRILTLPECLSALRSCLDSTDRKTRRTGLSWLLEATKDGLPEVLKRGMCDEDVVVRYMTARFIRTKLGKDANLAYLELLKKNLSARVRLEALYACVEHDLPIDLKEFLLDPSSAIRGAARHYLRESGFGDFASYYRDRLKTEHPAAISGLAETGEASDAAQIAPLAKHDRVSVSKAAIMALGLLGKEQFLGIFVSLLDSPKAGISRFASNELARIWVHLNPTEIWRVVSSGKTPACKLNALRVLAHFGKWRQLPFLLEACMLPDEGVASSAVKLVNEWLAQYNRVQTRPTQSELAAIWEVLPRAEPVVGPEASRQLGFVCQGWEIPN